MSGAMTEFKITSDLSALRQQVISANFAEVKAWLEENLAPYRDMAVSADDLSTAKTYRASIRKVKDRIEQIRKEAKSAALEAYSAFEVKCRELTGLCDEAANAIDGQVNAIENEEADAKIAEIRAAYDKTAVGELLAFCPWDFVYSKKWRNKGVSKETAIADVEAAVGATANDLTAIRATGGPDTAYLLDVYLQTHDLGTVIRKAADLKAVREREADRKRREAEDAEFQKVRADAIKQKSTPTGINVHEIMDSTLGADENPVQQAEYSNAAIGLKDSEMVTVIFKVVCTKAQLAALGEYMRKNGIQFGRA